VAYPNIHAAFKLESGGTKVRLTGPLVWSDLDIEKSKVIAFVTQNPTEERARPAALDAPTPGHTAIARGEKEFEKGASEWWVDAELHGETPFEDTWAWATAVSINMTKDGQFTTYTWSRWVFLTSGDLPPPTI
jgi:hypothetical protein